MEQFMEIMIKLKDLAIQYWWVLLIIVGIIFLIKVFGGQGSGSGGGGGDSDSFCNGSSTGCM